jgi:hypothetical membrane protein
LMQRKALALVPTGKGARLLAWAGITGPILFFLITTLAGWLRPGYDATRQTVSKLALGPGRWVETLAFCLLALSLLFFCATLWREVGNSWSGRCSVLSLGLVGAGFFLMAIFPAESGTWRGNVHQWVSQGMALLMVGGLWLFAIAMWGRVGWHRAGALALFIGTLSLALALGWKLLPLAWLTPWKGLYERALILVPLFWVVAIGIQILRRTEVRKTEARNK